MVAHGGGTWGHYSHINLLPDVDFGVHMSTSGQFEGLNDIKELIFIYVGKSGAKLYFTVPEKRCQTFCIVFILSLAVSELSGSVTNISIFSVIYS